ncbi:MAG: hypothetical protein Hals2KO_38840 [Halioglobus sp.]
MNFVDHLINRRFMCAALAMLYTLLAGCSDGSDNDSAPLPSSPLAIYQDPGTAPWSLVPREQVAETCGLDPDILDDIDSTATHSYAIVRYGKLCHEFYHPGDPGPDEVFNNFSSTKTLAAALVGRAVLMSAELPRPLRDTDRMDDWVDDISFNQDALVAHVLAMVGFNDSLAFGERRYSYDAAGFREINRLSDVVEAVIAQDPAHFGGVTTSGEFAQQEIFDRLGMTSSVWSGESFASTWESNLRDMARLGLFLLHNGVWDQQRLVSADWVYKMTHPVFEDANTAYGYLTWTAAYKNYYVPGLDIAFPQPIGECEPPALWREYPHGLSESPDCNYDGEFSCEQTYDVGAWSSLGAGGQNITVHRGLELVIVTRNAGPAAFVSAAWDLMRSALIARDPVYAGDEAAFCAAYRAGDYAPDLIVESAEP